MSLTPDMLTITVFSFIFAAVHIGLVVLYANWAGWGYIGIRDRIFGVPGGAMVTSPPIWEFVFYWFTPIETTSGIFVALVAGHMLAVRLLLNLIGVFAVFLRITGQIDGIICMDNRTWAQPKRANCNHSGLCGAFTTLSFIGFTPGLAVVGVLLAVGIPVPLWLTVIAAFPYFFVFGKHFHIVLFQVIGDVFHISEVPGWLVGSFPVWLWPNWQFCAYGGGHHHNHDE